MTTRLITENKLFCRANNVWGGQASAEMTGFSYSDGDQEENYIHSVLSSAQDISSWSEELESRIVDWASEAHLSSKRPNILRGIDFTGIDSVLEIGSGCGAISRYVGEQKVALDAVEGSARRAEVTRIRCRDLDNVNVINVPFDNLILPKSYYDMALLVGVLEYAGKYAEEGMSPEAAAEAMLQRILTSLKPDGVLIVAIENRIGFKYLAGASEDHFGVPYVGLSGYPEYDSAVSRGKKGIATWDKNQWQTMLASLSVAYEFCYPFPDYKLPESILSDAFISSAKFPWCCLNRVSSRDYTAVWKSTMDESLFWETVSSAKAFDKFANSFLIVLGKNIATVKNVFGFDFIHFPGHSRKKQYRKIIRKEKGDNLVRKMPLFHQLHVEENKLVQQVTSEELFLDDMLLSSHWTNVLRCQHGDFGSFGQVLREYYDFVQQIIKHVDCSRCYDLLPFNITRAKDGSYRHFDQEWQVREEISAAFILFRALVYFTLNNKHVLQQICTAAKLITVRDFVRYSLERTAYTGDWDIAAFIVQEDRIQNEISQSGQFVSVEGFLDSLISINSFVGVQEALLYWGDSLTQCSPISMGNLDGGCLSFVFRLPPEAGAATCIRFDPCEGKEHLDRVFKLKRIEYGGMTKDGSIASADIENLPLSDTAVQVEGLSYINNCLGGVYSVESEDPQMFFPVSGIPSVEHVAWIQCVVELEWLSISGFDLKFQQARASLQEKENQLNSIVRSRYWRFGEKLKKIIPRRVIRRLFGNLQRFMKTDSPKVQTGVIDVQFRTSISILVPVFNAGRDEILQLISSIDAQSYKNWELCFVDDASSDALTQMTLREINHPRIKVHHLEKSVNLTGAMNVALSLASGECILFLGQFDRLAPNALSLIADAFEETEADLVYYNEILLDLLLGVEKEIRKPAYSEDRLLSNNFFGCAFCIRSQLLNNVGFFNSYLDGAGYYDMVLRLTEKADYIHHISKGIYYRRYFSEKNSDEKAREHSAGKKSLIAAMERRGIDAYVEDEEELCHYRVVKKKDAFDHLL